MRRVGNLSQCRFSCCSPIRISSPSRFDRSEIAMTPFFNLWSCTVSIISYILFTLHPLFSSTFCPWYPTKLPRPPKDLFPVGAHGSSFLACCFQTCMESFPAPIFWISFNVGPDFVILGGSLALEPWLVLADDDTFCEATVGSELSFWVLYVVGRFDQLRTWGKRVGGWLTAWWGWSQRCEILHCLSRV